MVNKLMWQIDREDEALAAFRDDPAGFVATWEAMSLTAGPPYPDGGELTDEERDAFCRRDYPLLYSLGAHPYLLWHMVRAVESDPGTNVEALSDAFKAGIQAYGVPDFTT